jgi:hypothetical protein
MPWADQQDSSGNSIVEIHAFPKVNASFSLHGKRNRKALCDHTSDILFGKGGYSSSTMRNRADMAIKSAYGGFPVNSSISVQPKDLKINIS